MTTRRSFLAAAAAMTLMAPMPAFAQTKAGVLKGKGNYKTRGTAQLIQKGGKTTIELSSDFTFSGAPDAKIALGTNGIDKSKILAPLKKNKGAQSYVVPANMDISKVNEIWIWCEKFSVPLGVAKIK
jgi:hypothetical protein